MDVRLTSPTGKNPEEDQQRIMEERVQRQLVNSYKEELVRAAQSTPVFQRPTVVRTNEVEERERYRYQWRKEDRQRIFSDRLELIVAIVTGMLMGVLRGDFGGVVIGGLTGAVIWFTTGLIRNWWSP
ncbi:uncharacterized protein ACWYII_004148 [Salvelinus alpinus]